MEEDKLLQFHERLKDFLQKHLTLLLNIVLAFALVIIFGALLFYYQKNKEKKAFEELYQIIHKNDFIALQSFAKKYASSQAGLYALLIIWEDLTQSHALKAKKEFLPILKKAYPKGLSNFLLYTEAKLLEDSGQKEEALKIYQKLLEKEPVLRELLYLDLGRLFASTNPQLAKKYYMELIKNYPQAFGVPLAQYKVLTLP